MLLQRKRDSKSKRQAVVSAIEALEHTHSPITVAEVARRAHVSSWLVRQEPLLGQVRKAQARASAGDIAPEWTARSAAGSLHVERDLLRHENRRLRHQMERQQQRISLLLGDQIDGTDAQSQRLHVQELTAQNTALSRQAREALQERHQLEQTVTELSADLQAAHTVNRADGTTQPAKIAVTLPSGSPPTPHSSVGKGGISGTCYSSRQRAGDPQVTKPTAATWGLMTSSKQLLTAYDEQLRTDAETPARSPLTGWGLYAS
jgi:hypothetical protein